MFCEKCGAQVENDSKFCLNCGSPVTPQAAPVAVAAPAGPSALAKFFSNKKNVTITAIVAAVVVVAIVAIIIISSLPAAIYMDDYMKIEYSGLDGMGHAYMTGDGEQLMKDLQKHMSEEEVELMMTRLMKKGMTFELGKTDELSNGDKIPLILEVDNDIAKEYGVVFKLRSETTTVSGLKASTLLDLFADLVITYEGFAPNAYVRVESTSDNAFIKNYVNYSVSDGYNIENGDTFTVEAYFSNSEAMEQGYLIKETSREYTASNVPVPVELDLFADLEITYTGCEPYAKVTVTSKSTNEFIQNYVSYYVTNGKNLSEGDVFTVNASYSSYTAEQHGYIINEDTKDYTATDLPEPVELNVFDHVQVIFTGIEGKGKATYKVTTDDIFIKSYVRFQFNKSTNLSEGDAIALIYTVSSYVDPLEYGYKLTETTSKSFTVPALGKAVTNFTDLSSVEQNRVMEFVLKEAEGYLTKEGATASGLTLYNTGYSAGNQLSNATSLSNLKVKSVIYGQQGSWTVTNYLVFVVTVDISGHPNLPATNGSATGHYYFYVSSPIVKADGTLENDLEDSLVRGNYCYKSYEDLCEFYLDNIKNQVVFEPNA